MEDFLTQRDFDIQKELGCRINMYLGKILWQTKNVSYRIFYSLDWFDTIGKYSILREYVLRMDLMHSGNLVILYTMSGWIPSYGVHCPSRNTPQRNLRKQGDLIWGDLVAHSQNELNFYSYIQKKGQGFQVKGTDLAPIWILLIWLVGQNSK